MSVAIFGMMTSSDGRTGEGGAEPLAVVAGHGEFASGMVSAVQQITGKGALFRTVSNAALDARALEDVIRTALRESGARMVFTDLPAGSCTMAARRVARDMPTVGVVTGANLAMLLEFAMGGDGATVERLIAKGHASIAGAPPRDSAHAD